ncbi:MAG: carboxymuconolactone decarboxylase family protein [Dongiaceae bacterium]
MARLSYLEPATAPGKSKDMLNAVQAKLGTIPNIFKALANSPAALGAYQGMSAALSEASLTPAAREAIALAVAEENSCQYCLSAHTAIGKKAGLTDEAALSARNYQSTDAKTAAALKLTKTIIQTKGNISDTDLQSAKQQLSEGEIAEVVACIAINFYTNFFNHVAQTDVDFPKVMPGKKAA